MPYAKSTSKRYGKSRFKKGVKRQQRGKSGGDKIFRSVRTYGIKPDPFPARLHTRMKYVKVGALAANAITPNTTGLEQAFRLTSIYDPDYTGVGYTTVGHSNFVNLYANYIVKGAKVEITWSDPERDGQVSFCSLNQTANVENKPIQDNLENSLVYSTRTNNTGSQKNKMKFYINPWSLKGLSKLEWMANKTGHSAAISANPTTDIYLRLATASTNATTYGSTIQYEIRIIYYTEFYNRRQTFSSLFT